MSIEAPVSQPLRQEGKRCLRPGVNGIPLPEGCRGASLTWHGEARWALTVGARRGRCPH